MEANVVTDADSRGIAWPSGYDTAEERSEVVHRQDYDDLLWCDGHEDVKTN